MRKLQFCCTALLAALPLLSGCGQSGTTQLSVISYNIRMGVADDGENSWEHRRPATIEMLKESLIVLHKPIFALIFQDRTHVVNFFCIDLFDIDWQAGGQIAGFGLTVDLQWTCVA